MSAVETLPSLLQLTSCGAVMKYQDLGISARVSLLWMVVASSF